jgi:hypothetical protein
MCVLQLGAMNPTRGRDRTREPVGRAQELFRSRHPYHGGKHIGEIVGPGAQRRIHFLPLPSVCNGQAGKFAEQA